MRKVILIAIVSILVVSLKAQNFYGIDNAPLSGFTISPNKENGNLVILSAISASNELYDSLGNVISDNDPVVFQGASGRIDTAHMSLRLQASYIHARYDYIGKENKAVYFSVKNKKYNYRFKYYTNTGDSIIITNNNLSWSEYDLGFYAIYRISKMSRIKYDFFYGHRTSSEDRLENMFDIALTTNIVGLSSAIDMAISKYLTISSLISKMYYTGPKEISGITLTDSSYMFPLRQNVFKIRAILNVLRHISVALEYYYNSYTAYLVGGYSENSYIAYFNPTIGLNVLSNSKFGYLDIESLNANMAFGMPLFGKNYYRPFIFSIGGFVKFK